MNKSTKIIGNSRSHGTLLSRLQKFPPSRVLDIPTGQGALAHILIEKGWDVTCADIDPGLFKLDNARFYTVDLNRKLPFDDESFDFVVCANGIHRLFNPAGAISEFSRILRPNGMLFINTNNYASIYHRFRFLFYGSLDNYINSQWVGQTVNNPEAHIRNAIMVPQILNSLESNEFCLEDIRPAAIQKRQILLYPFSLVLKIFSFVLPQKEKNRVNWTSSSAVALGHYILIEARKKEQMT